jgi:hypothetical protein
LPQAKFGAGDGIQTRDLCLGKATLYQLSYSRIDFQKINYSTLLSSRGLLTRDRRVNSSVAFKATLYQLSYSRD